MDTLLTFPTVDDYRVRLRRMQEAMQQANLDVAVLSGFDNHRFFGAVDGIATVRTIWIVIPVGADPLFVSPRIEASEIEQQSWIPVAQDWVEWVEGSTPTSHIEALSRVLGRSKFGNRIGVDFDATSALNLENLRAVLPDAHISDATSMLREVRKVKDRATIDVVRRSADIAAAQYTASVESAAPGVPEWEVALASRSAGMRRAAHWWAGDLEHSPLIQGIHVMASGPDRVGRAHAVAAGRVMEPGDILQLCYCGRPFFGHGICFDRPVVIGDVRLSREAQKVVDAARAAQEAALAVVRPGVTSGQVHDAAVDTIRRHGIDSAFRHRTGRGIGLSDPEWPEIKAGDTTVIEEGMIIAIEPGVYVDGVAGARFGDTVLVTSHGYEPLTQIELGRRL